MSRSERRVEVGRRVDGTSWSIRVIEHRSDADGPTTVVLGGMLGDKPLGCLAVHEIDRRLSAAADLAGRVVLVPAANPPALEHATRENPDHLTLTRQFPGAASGFLTDQLAAALLDGVISGADCVIDLHSGSPTMALSYTYDYGDRQLSAAFGHLPVVLGHTAPGQLGLLADELGIGFLLPEFGGGPLADPSVGVEGVVNVLRSQGQLTGAMSGPATVPLIERKDLFRASAHGVLVETNAHAGGVGGPITAGELGRLVDVATGETIETFEIAVDSILLMARTIPMMVRPGDFAFMTGVAVDQLRVGG